MTLGHPTRPSGLVKGAGHAAEDLVGEAGYSGPAEQCGQVLRGERRSSGMGGLLPDDLQDGGRAQVKLVGQEIVRVDCLQPERAEPGSSASASAMGTRTHASRTAV